MLFAFCELESSFSKEFSKLDKYVYMHSCFLDWIPQYSIACNSWPGFPLRIYTHSSNILDIMGLSLLLDVLTAHGAFQVQDSHSLLCFNFSYLWGRSQTTGSWMFIGVQCSPSSQVHCRLHTINHTIDRGKGFWKSCHSTGRFTHQLSSFVYQVLVPQERHLDEFCTTFQIRHSKSI